MTRREFDRETKQNIRGSWMPRRWKLEYRRRRYRETLDHLPDRDLLAERARLMASLRATTGSMPPAEQLLATLARGGQCRRLAEARLLLGWPLLGACVPLMPEP